MAYLLQVHGCFLFSYIVVNCGRLEDPQNGKVSIAETTYNSVATYTCNDSYTLLGDVERRCLSSGAWSVATPTCIGRYQLIYVVHSSLSKYLAAH